MSANKALANRNRFHAIAVQPSGKPSSYARLSIMMFLQYAVWGIWLPVLGQYLEGYLGFSGAQIGMILGLAGSVGAISAPFIAGQVADRYFSTEKFLGFLLIVGGIIKWITAYMTGYMPWLLLSIAYSVVYMPTLALTNSLAMAHLDDPNREFSLVRVWGTIGWIVAGWVFSILWLQTNIGFTTLPPFVGGIDRPDVTLRLVDALKFSGILSILYGVYCYSLPKTPPKKDAIAKLAFVKAFALLKRPSFAVLVSASLLVSIVHQIYFMKTGQFLVFMGLKEGLIPQVMSIGQFAEIIVLAMLGLMLKRLGFKGVLFIGGLAYFARYAIFGTTTLPLSVIVVSQALHGICFACFFAAAFIYVDRVADVDIRHSAQTVFGIIILGGGPVLGGILLGMLEKWFTVEGVLNYSQLWYTLAGIGLAAALLIISAFKDEGPVEQDSAA